MDQVESLSARGEATVHAEDLAFADRNENEAAMNVQLLHSTNTKKVNNPNAVLPHGLVVEGIDLGELTSGAHPPKETL